MENSKISWTDHTFNPWWGCVHVSPGCDHCYAETWANRYNPGLWGVDGTRRLFGDNHWNAPVKWNAAAEKAGVRARVFCASMADVFESRDDVFEARLRLWELIHRTPWLDWMLLTKRPENIMARLPHGWSDDPMPNVWLGTTCENQEQADKRIPELLKVPAAVRFLSCEPLLGPVNLDFWIDAYWNPNIRDLITKRKEGSWVQVESPAEQALHWVICGGESGHGARPMKPDWARSLRDQCQAAGVAYHFKQWGEWRPAEGQYEHTPSNISPADLGRFFTVEGNTSELMRRVGKKEAGRLLDGVEWNEFPQTAVPA